ncbi:MAG TPA: hypothetical protein VFC07_07200 [Verrucomicrobiae bacterium]|nr:hypothetical protein [Verrucomicrobiae bacterium]
MNSPPTTFLSKSDIFAARSWEESLRRGVGEFKVGDNGNVGIATDDELFGGAALKFAKPMAGGSLEVLPEETLHLKK